MTKYILGIKFEKCTLENNYLCLFKYTNKCEQNLTRCVFPISANPLCTVEDKQQCRGKFKVVSIDGDTYILYSCFNCKHLVKNRKEFLDKMKQLVNKPNIIYGKELDELVRKIESNKPKTNYDNIQSALEYIIVNINTSSLG